MIEKLSPEQVRRYWEGQAAQHLDAPAASWSDRRMIELEIRTITEYLVDGESVLDVGCANGYSSLRFAAAKRVDIQGFDYIPNMIEQARAQLAKMAGGLRGTAEFGVGDVTAIDASSDTFDKVLSIRVMINLGDWETQLKALRECVRVLKPGGTLLLSEATVQGWTQLNTFRREWGLPDIPMPGFNCYLDQAQVISALADTVQLVELQNFASTYYIGTRVLKPLLIRALGADIDVANPEMEWNNWFAQLPAWGDYGTQKLFVFRKL